MARRTATVPDAHLFELAMRDVAPLKRRKARAKPAAAPVAAEPVPVPVVRRTAYVPLPVQAPPPRAPSRKAPEPGLDKNTARRFERGELPIDSAIDLHGLTQARAHERLDAFVGNAVKAGARVLLVVTGKGRLGEGILRKHVPDWLKLGPHASRILRLASARLQHGGEGAYYVLLRRNR
ncbi:MAG: Smr/MutS family protein [Proteobacteria bacterium]|nr:Smr/MutS family protein [Pseudomonadota bacterium]